MKRNIIFIYLLLLSTICFSQQNLPGRIIGRIPDISSAKLYEIQVGAFKEIKNAEDYASRLKRGGLIPTYERYLDFTRVKITGISANQIKDFLISIKQLGFDEVIIREDTTRYIIIEEPEEEPEEEIVEEVIEEVIVEEPEITPEPPRRDIFCRTWSIVNSGNTDYVGYILIFSDDGTYLITNINGESTVAKWRWLNENKEFEYTHNNWRSYGRIIIDKLDETTLTFRDPGYDILFNGHSPINKDATYELVPTN